MKTIFQRSAVMLASALLFTFTTTVASVAAQNAADVESLHADLSSFNQVPAVVASSHGELTAAISSDGIISYTLSYANMSSPVTQAHIHFGASKTNGGVMVYLCGGSYGAPACPASGSVTGTLTAFDVSVLPASSGDSVIPQGIPRGDLAGMLQAIRTGNAYVNVHTSMFPSGELRGQVKLR